MICFQETFSFFFGDLRLYAPVTCSDFPLTCLLDPPTPIPRAARTIPSVAVFLFTRKSSWMASLWKNSQASLPRTTCDPGNHCLSLKLLFVHKAYTYFLFPGAPQALTSWLYMCESHGCSCVPQPSQVSVSFLRSSWSVICSKTETVLVPPYECLENTQHTDKIL